MGSFFQKVLIIAAALNVTSAFAQEATPVPVDANGIRGAYNAVIEEMRAQIFANQNKTQEEKNIAAEKLMKEAQEQRQGIDQLIREIERMAGQTQFIGVMISGSSDAVKPFAPTGVFGAVGGGELGAIGYFVRNVHAQKAFRVSPFFTVSGAVGAGREIKNLNGGNATILGMKVRLILIREKANAVSLADITGVYQGLQAKFALTNTVRSLGLEVYTQLQKCDNAINPFTCNVWIVGATPRKINGLKPADLKFKGMYFETFGDNEDEGWQLF
ncbi:MAG TPA: DUF1542 domain-containing protein [Bdellovibrionales bacterium]|nr:DUF1542 domain-containing protein [Bdellovibrionales bacterium]